MVDIPITFGGHLAYLLCVFSVFLSDIMSDVLRENVGHGVQNVGHPDMSDDFHIHWKNDVYYRQYTCENWLTSFS